MKRWGLSVLGVMLAPALVLASAAAAVTAPQMHTVAGGGPCDPSVTAAASGAKCDNVAATSVAIAQAGDVAALPGGGFLYVDSNPNYNLVRAVSKSGKVATVAGMPPTPGGGPNTDAPDGTPAVNSWLGGPVAVAPLPGGGFLITEKDSSVIRMVSPGGPGTATITTIAGTGTPGFNGTDGPATSIQLSYPSDAQPLADGRVVIADTGNNLIRVLSAAAPGATVTTVAGGGSCDDVTSSCDGMAAGAVKLNDPVSVSPIQGGAGGFLVAEDDARGANAIRGISQVSPSGTFTTVAGTPGQGRGYGGDGGPAVFAQLNNPQRVLSTAGGGFLIADTDNERVRAVSPTGTITTVAGNGLASYAGDNGPATLASLFGPIGISPTTGGGLLIADKSDAAVRELTLAPTTAITTSPSSPNGTNGWFIGTVHATLSGGSGTSTSCNLDFAPVPDVFDVLTSPCPFTGQGGNITGNGTHVLYAASMNSFGDKEAPVGFTIAIDSSPPGVQCKSHQTFLAGSRGRVTATVTDSISGPAAPVISARANTGRVGVHSVELLGLSNAGIANVTRCRYTVLAPRLRPAPYLRWMFTTVGNATSVGRLTVDNVAAHAAVNLTCQGNGCPFSTAMDVTGARCGSAICTATPKQRRDRRTVDLTGLFSGVRLDAGAHLAISVTKANTVGGEWLFTINSGKAPSHRAVCLEPGSSTPGKGCTLPSKR